MKTWAEMTDEEAIDFVCQNYGRIRKEDAEKISEIAKKLGEAAAKTRDLEILKLYGIDSE